MLTKGHMRFKQQIIVVFAIVFSYGAHGQYCTAVGPSQVTWSNVESAQLIGDASSITYTGCPGVAGLEDLTGSQSVSLSANSSYTLNVQFGTCDNNWPGAGEAWIDFDGNETFDPGESLGTWQGTPPVAMSNFNFTVPSNCANGTVRLRITQQEDATPPLNPCASFTWGCMIDFTVELSGGTGPNLISYCESVGPSSNADSNLEQLLVSGEGGTAIGFTGCPGVIGLDNQLMNQSVDIAPGNSYQAHFIFGTCGGTYAGAAEAWIDYNINGIFEPSESIGTWTGTPPGDTTFNFTVPGGLTYGDTRLRVVQQEGGTLPLDPCGTFTWGSTTDFTVVIGDPVDCSGYVGDDKFDPRIVGSLPFQEDHSNLTCYSNNVLVYNSPDVFYRLVPADYGVDFFNVSLCGSVIDTYLQIQDNDGNVIASNDDYVQCGAQSEVSFYSGSHDTLYIIVQGWNNEKGDYSIAINDANLVSLEEEVPDFDVYPNPSNGIVYITGEQSFKEVAIFDLNGRKLKEYTELNSGSLDLTGFGSGIYMLIIYTEHSQSIHKIVLDHDE